MKSGFEQCRVQLDGLLGVAPLQVHVSCREGIVGLRRLELVSLEEEVERGSGVSRGVRYGQPIFDALANPPTVKTILKEPYADAEQVAACLFGRTR